jgi:medium-chain acyl-[acyl-carrier-protein] hydrolase
VRPRRQPALRMFCFPYAGGSAHIFRNWAKALSMFAEVRAVELPGRGARLREQPYSSLPELVEQLAGELAPWFDKPCVFFGHSMGALISFELARHLRAKKQTGPVQLFVSGRRAPHLPRTKPPIHNLSGPDFLRKLHEINDTPRESLENPELMELVLPFLRADFKLIETYVYSAQAPFECPIVAFGGLQDQSVTIDDLEGWRQHTTAPFALSMFSGGHFFLGTSEAMVLEQMARKLNSLHNRLLIPA